MSIAKAAALLSMGLLACGGSEGTEPHDMSAAQHERTAGAEEAAARQHGSQYDPGAKKESLECDDAVPCWTSTANPTEEHQQDVARHGELAAKHRAASQALRDAEAKACAGVPAGDRDMSPFRHREEITSVTEITRPEQRGTAEPYGARAVFRAVPGLTEQWLQRIVDCHMARAAALGYEVPGMEYCPLTLKNVTAVITPAGDGFAIDVTTSDYAVSREVLRRMRAAASGQASAPGSSPSTGSGP